MYAYVIILAAAGVAVVQVVFGDGIEWVPLIAMTAVVTFGLWIGRFIRARRAATR